MASSGVPVTRVALVVCPDRGFLNHDGGRRTNLPGMDRAALRRPSRVSLATGLIVLGLLGLVLWKVASASEALPYSNDAAPPASVEVTRGHTYSLAVPGGADAMVAAGIRASGSGSLALTCRYASAGAPRLLQVSPEATGTKAENTVARFVAPLSGRISVSCDGWGAVFVPDSDDRPTDWSGWALLVGVGALSVGAGLALSAAHRRWTVLAGAGSGPAEPDDEVESRVDVEVPGVGEDEVGRGDARDVVP
jgi:hypothetical protein